MCIFHNYICERERGDCSEMDMANQVQILDKAVGISHMSNTLEKDMNQCMGK